MLGVSCEAQPKISNRSDSCKIQAEASNWALDRRIFWQRSRRRERLSRGRLGKGGSKAWEIGLFPIKDGSLACFGQFETRSSSGGRRNPTPTSLVSPLFSIFLSSMGMSREDRREFVSCFCFLFFFGIFGWPDGR